MNTFSDTTKSSDQNLSRGTTSSNNGLLNPLTMRARRIKKVSLQEKLYRGLTSPIRLLPDFLVIGTRRGGTTPLYHYLQTHPCIKSAIMPNTLFFTKNFNKGLAWYQGHFPTRIERYYAQHLRGRAFLTGEVSSSYLFYPHTPNRVAKVLPHVKLIVLLRNPVDRAYSQYFYSVELGHETLSFEEAIEREEERTAREWEQMLKDEYYESYANAHFSYLSRGIYVNQLQVWMNLFPREQCLILKSEDFYADPVTSFKQVLVFLNLPETEPKLRKEDYEEYRDNTYLSKMGPALRKRLLEYFEPHNARLYDYLGINFGWNE